MAFSALPSECREYRTESARSPLNWRVQVTINAGQVVKNFYARSEELAQAKAEEWIERHWPGATGRHQQPPYD